ncbi:MAG TPA: MFS transporter [Alphaproteobacteria bacterium]|nr:MFS transporter [Alphaproteobacteria bacterium]
MQDRTTNVHHSVSLVLASIIGTILEFYGFTIFVIFGDVIAANFFPLQAPTLSLLWVYAIFASSFLMRPLGAALFGYIGDKYGRQWALYLSISLMGLTLFTIGMLPTYESVGMLAPVMIVFCRLLQGVCAGGEYNNAGIFAIESFENRPALAGSLVAFGAGMGALFAISMKQFSYYSIEGLDLWRLPFLIGALISFMGVLLRRNIKEFFSLESPKPIPWKFLLEYKASSLTAFSIGAIDGAFAYVMVAFMGTYLHLFIGLEQSESTQICMYAFAAYLFFAPLIGYLADYVDTHFLFRAVVLLVIPMTYLVFILITSRCWILILTAELIFAFMYAALSALQHTYLLSLFPPQLRSRGVGVSFSIGGALFGGGAPLILISLLGIYSDTMIPGYFLMLVSLFCLATCMVTSQKGPSHLTTAPI